MGVRSPRRRQGLRLNLLTILNETIRRKLMKHKTVVLTLAVAFLAAAVDFAYGDKKEPTDVTAKVAAAVKD